jgi:hypothetical protein
LLLVNYEHKAFRYPDPQPVCEGGILP